MNPSPSNTGPALGDTVGISLAMLGLAGVLIFLSLSTVSATTLALPELDNLAASVDTQADTWSRPLGVVVAIGGLAGLLRSVALGGVGIVAGLGIVIIPGMIRSQTATTAPAGGAPLFEVLGSEISALEIAATFLTDPNVWIFGLALLIVRSFMKSRQPRLATALEV